MNLKVEESLQRLPKMWGDLCRNPGCSNVDVFTYEEMRLATMHFQPVIELGEGGFGIVYKGVIDESVRPGYETTNVAIKVLAPQGFQGDREWLAEVSYLGQLSHPNLVKLIGYCCEDDHRLLVYEHMAFGSLEKHLYQRDYGMLTWSRRMKIALDAARGLAFLHVEERTTIYRIFKTSSILLDEVTSQDGPMQNPSHAQAMHNSGYEAPEYLMNGLITDRGGVYGFGVVLLEMLIGRRAVNMSRPRGEPNLVEWAHPLLIHKKKLLRILDLIMEGQYSTRTAREVACMAYQCLSYNPRERPR